MPISSVLLLVGMVSASSASTASSTLSASPGRVTIYRDEWGVPHIFAEREEDGFYGLGYAMAEDELDYLLRLFLMARGEQASVFGSKFVDSDFLSRLWRHAEESQAGFARMSPELQRNYRGYMAGVERYLAEHPAERPAGMPKLEPWDPVAVSRWLLWMGYQVADGYAECRAAGVKLAAQVDSALGDRTRAASNEWLLAPWRTAAGAMTVLSDPHGGVDGQFVYEFRMHAGRFESFGYALGAMPLLVSTRHVAWGMTTGAPDVSDCYEIELDPASPRRYLYDGKPAPIEARRVTVRVKDGAPVTRTLEYTRHNGVASPVVARAGGKAYVVSTAFMHDAGLFDDEVYRMNLARNVGEVKQAMKLLGMFPQNVMVGDADGGSFYLRAGKTPRRPAGFDWKRPVPGNTSRSAWTGYHPLEDLVQLESPAAGYMQNNNIAPDRMLLQSPLTPDRYPAYIYNDRPGRINSRGGRAVEVLSRAYRFTVEDAIDLALDEKWVETELWQDALRHALEQEAERVRRAPPAFRELADRLLRFDGHARAGSVAALDFWYWREALSALPGGPPMEVVSDSLPRSGPLSARVSRQLLDAADSIVSLMQRRYGGTDPTLGTVFRIGRTPDASWPLGGVAVMARERRQCEALVSWNHVCVHTLRAYTPGAPDSLGRRMAEIGSRLLRLTIFTNPVQIYTLHNFGQSGRPRSPHYADQAKLTSERRLKPVYLDKAELMPHVTSERTLEVPGRIP